MKSKLLTFFFDISIQMFANKWLMLNCYCNIAILNHLTVGKQMINSK